MQHIALLQLSAQGQQTVRRNLLLSICSLTQLFFDVAFIVVLWLCQAFWIQYGHMLTTERAHGVFEGQSAEKRFLIDSAYPPSFYCQAGLQHTSNLHWCLVHTNPRKYKK